MGGAAVGNDDKVGGHVLLGHEPHAGQQLRQLEERPVLIGHLIPQPQL